METQILQEENSTRKQSKKIQIKKAPETTEDKTDEIQYMLYSMTSMIFILKMNVVWHDH